VPIAINILHADRLGASQSRAADNFIAMAQLPAQTCIGRFKLASARSRHRAVVTDVGLRELAVGREPHLVLTVAIHRSDQLFTQGLAVIEGRQQAFTDVLSVADLATSEDGCIGGVVTASGDTGQ